MKEFYEKMKVEIALRLGLGLMYFYSGYDFLVHPEHWQSFVPQWFIKLIAPVMTLETHLMVQGIVELAIGVVFLAWFMPKKLVKCAAFISTVELFLILMLVGVDLITFRDIGLVAASLALFLILEKEELHIVHE